MKTCAINFLAAALVCALTVDVQAQFGQTIRVEKIMGKAVQDSSGQKIGSLKDLAIDLENGRIVEVMVSSGGFLGVDRKITTALPQDFSLENDGATLRLNLTREKLEHAPTVDLSTWPDSVAQPRLEDTYQYYGVTPYFRVPQHQAHQASNPTYLHLGSVERAGALLGADTVNQKDQQAGQVKDLVVDFSQGRLVEVVINSGRFLDMPDELSPLPPQALRYDSARGVLTLNATRDHMFTMPHFRSGAWPALDRSQAASVYQAWHVVPYFLPIGVSLSAENVPPVNNSKIVAAPEQGASNADEGITARIKKELMESPDLSPDAKAVKVLTFNGRVTLRGAVESDREKRRVGEIAARIVPVEDVDNQLIVQQTASNAP